MGQLVLSSESSGPLYDKAKYVVKSTVSNLVTVGDYWPGTYA